MRADRQQRRQARQLVRLVYGPRRPLLSIGCLALVMICSGLIAGAMALAALTLWRLVA